MKIASRIVATCCITASLAAASAAQAHGIWFAQRAKQLALIYGVGADDLDIVKRLPLVQGVAGYDADYKPVPTALRATGPVVVVDSDAPAAVVTAFMDYGVWSKTPDGEWHKKGRDEVPTAVSAEKTMKYAVHIGGTLTKPLPALAGQKIQIVPVAAAIPQQMGQPIKLRILFDGKPMAGVSVINDYVNDPDQVPVKSAADGTVTVPVRNQGLNVIAATYIGPSDQPAKYDRIEYRGTLSFVLPHAPE